MKWRILRNFRRYSSLGAWLAVITLALLLAVGLPLRGNQNFPRETILIETSKQPIDLLVEIADSPAERTQGLMYRKSIGEKEGMLFLFDKEQMVSMWMKNTYLPLDMLFIDRIGTIKKIVRSTTPHSLELISSGIPVLAILELPAGTADKFSIEEGDRIYHKAFGKED